MKLRKLAIIFLFLFSGCSSNDKSEELLFLENVMIREGGLYVLMGSKPMCSFPIEDSGFPESDEEIERAYNLYASEIGSISPKESPISYDKFLQNCRNCTHLHHRKLWETNEKKLKASVGPRYRFVVRRNPFGEQRKTGLFINVPNMLLTLKKYYQEFLEVYGKAFEPEVVLNELSDENSAFWSSVFSSNYTQGLLFGYGRHNSYEFDWQMKNAPDFPHISNNEYEIETLMRRNIKFSDLRLPSISIYSVNDNKIEKYRKEREQILKELDGKDFEQTVKMWLGKGLKML